MKASAIGPGVAGYIAEFGDRCTEELKLESVTLDEDPTPLFAAIAAAARSRHAPPGSGAIPGRGWTGR